MQPLQCILGNRLLCSYNTIAMWPWCIHFGKRQKREKKNENLMSRNTSSSSKQYYLLEYLVLGLFCFIEQAEKKNKKKTGGKNWRSYYDVPWYLVYVSHQGRFGQPRTNWRRGRLQKPATTRDRCVVHMCASSVLSPRVTSPAPAQRKNCRYFST